MLSLAGPGQRTRLTPYLPYTCGIMCSDSEHNSVTRGWTMKKILNRPADFVPEMLDGLVKAHPDQLAYEEDLHCIVRADSPVQGKVGLMTGGGSGHLPVFLGYVGKGMLDGCAVGDVFASPSPEQMYNVTKRINGGKGVLYLYGNYGGDVMNFDMAGEMAAMDDIPTK